MLKYFDYHLCTYLKHISVCFFTNNAFQLPSKAEVEIFFSEIIF